MKIYVWTKDETDLVEELNILNSLIVKHGAEGYSVFKVCIDHLLLPEKAFILFFSCEKEIKRKMNTDWDFFIKPFEMKTTNSEVWDNDYFKRVEFIYYKCILFRFII